MQCRRVCVVRCVDGARLIELGNETDDHKQQKVISEQWAGAKIKTKQAIIRMC